MLCWSGFVYALYISIKNLMDIVSFSVTASVAVEFTHNFHNKISSR